MHQNAPAWSPRRRHCHEFLGRRLAGAPDSHSHTPPLPGNRKNGATALILELWDRALPLSAYLGSKNSSGSRAAPNTPPDLGLAGRLPISRHNTRIFTSARGYRVHGPVLDRKSEPRRQEPRSEVNVSVPKFRQRENIVNWVRSLSEQLNSY